PTEGVPATPAPRSVTVTPGNTLPDSSTILPIISPVVRCAAAGAARPNASSRTAHRHFITPPTFLQPAQRDQRRADVPRSGCAGRSPPRYAHGGECQALTAVFSSHDESQQACEHQ